MGIADTTEVSVLALIFNGTAWAGIAQNHGTPDASVAIALATADPLDAGDMTTSEHPASGGYTGYVRQNISRSGTTGWTAPTGSPTATNLQANCDFPATNGAATTITHFSIGKIGGGAVQRYFNGAVSPSIALGASGIIPRLTTSTNVQMD